MPARPVGGPEAAQHARAIVNTVHGNYAGVFLVVVGGALFVLLAGWRRAGRGLARDVRGRFGLLRWIGVAIVIVVLLVLAGVLPDR